MPRRHWLKTGQVSSGAVAWPVRTLHLNGLRNASPQGRRAELDRRRELPPRSGGFVQPPIAALERPRRAAEYPSGYTSLGAAAPPCTRAFGESATSEAFVAVGIRAGCRPVGCGPA